MIKCLATLIILFLAGIAQGQTIYVGGGQNFSFISNGSLDYVIKSYNDQRSHLLTKQMDDFRFMYGGTVSTGVVGESGLSIDMAWVGRHMKHSAESLDSALDLKLRNNSFNLGFGYSFTNQTIFCPGMLMSFDFGSFKTFARAGLPGDIGDIEYDRVMKETQMGMTFSLNLMLAGKKKPIGFTVRPYYQFQFFEPDFQELNDVLNPSTAANDQSLDLKENLGNFGVQVMILLAFRRD